ncbi:MAG: hypothetical protein HFE62_00960 [Firmicutes bacterium]|nr:hypothetical protein [Bacillota bacterium]
MTTILITSVISMITVFKTASPAIEGPKGYEDLSAFNFQALSGGIEMKNSGQRVTFSWENIEDKFWVSSFGTSINDIPSEEYLDLCSIPEGSKTMQVDINVGGMNQKS